MQISKKYHYSDVFLVPKPSEIQSRKDVNVEVSYITKHSKKEIRGVPVIVANLDTTGTFAMAKSLAKHKMFVSLHKYYNHDKLISFFFDDPESSYSFLTIGLKNIDINLEILKKLEKAPYFKYLMIDIANGYAYSFLDYIKKIRNLYPSLIIGAGNVATPEGVENIIKAGADIVKAGIGNGNLCLSSAKAGIGYPQFSVAQECGQAANELDALCISDGGVKNIADICLGLAAGSHFIMAGSLFAGYDECEGEWMTNAYDITSVTDYETKFLTDKLKLKVYGMSSKTANDKYNGGLQGYRASEGIEERWIDYKGRVDKLALDIKGSLASCCSYCNTSNLENLKKNAVFILK